MTEYTQAEGSTDTAADEQQELTANAVDEQPVVEPAAEGSAPAASEGGTSGPAVDLDDAEQQVAEWRIEDQALLGEAPELAPAPAGGSAAPPTSASEADIASMREETEALLGEGLEAKSLPTAEESQL